MRMIIICFLAFVATILAAYPLLYDVTYSETGTDSVLCRFRLRDMPPSASVALYDYATGCELYTHPVRQGAVVDSFAFHAPGFRGDSAYAFVLVDGRMYGEMVYIPAGRYAVVNSSGTIEQYSVKPFYIGKREVCNEQFRMFIAADGYDDETFWRIEGDLMKDPNIGWHYQGLKRMSKPWDWDFSEKPWFANVALNNPLDPVCGVTWFESYAFSRWIGGNLPEWEQLMACFRDELDEVNPVASTLEVIGVNDSAAEWTLYGIDPTGISCGGCNEMRILENNEKTQYPFPVSYYKCPLFRNDFLGFRIAISATD